MFGAGLQFGRSRGEDRFYNPAKARSTRRGQLNQDHLRRALSGVTASQSKSSVASKEPENKQPAVLPAALEPVLSPLCNLERFLESIIPSVSAQYLSKTNMRGWRTCDAEFQPYFVLGDLWESFKEWSAYGAGVPLLLNDSDSVVQYYVPYLSGIQLYGSRSKSSVKSSRPGEDSDADFRDSSSDGSSDYEHDRGRMSYLREQRSYNHPTGEVPLRMEHLSLHDQHIALQEGFSSDEGESGNSQGCLLFEYLERDPPFGREPLADKISDLALRFPELKTLRSCDLQSSSWISVAWYHRHNLPLTWRTCSAYRYIYTHLTYLLVLNFCRYPIYRIPMGPTLKDLDACFLTFHPLYTPMTGNQSGPALVPAAVVAYPSEMDGFPKISLPVFGLASYKFKLSLWTDNGQLVSSLLQAADNWLSLLLVNHPDFRFFCRR